MNDMMIRAKRVATTNRFVLINSILQSSLELKSRGCLQELNSRRPNIRFDEAAEGKTKRLISFTNETFIERRFECATKADVLVSIRQS
jgi:hypothetical protein